MLYSSPYLPCRQPVHRESNMNASRESKALLAELDKPEPSWPLPQPRQATRGRGSADQPSVVPFAISRKWAADLKACHDRVSSMLTGRTVVGAHGRVGRSEGGGGRSSTPRTRRIGDIMCYVNTMGKRKEETRKVDSRVDGHTAKASRQRDRDSTGVVGNDVYPHSCLLGLPIVSLCMHPRLIDALVEIKCRTAFPDTFAAGGKREEKGILFFERGCIIGDDKHQQQLLHTQPITNTSHHPRQQ